MQGKGDWNRQKEPLRSHLERRDTVLQLFSFPGALPLDLLASRVRRLAYNLHDINLQKILKCYIVFSLTVKSFVDHA